MNGQCIEAEEVWMVMGGLNVLTDLVPLALPATFTLVASDAQENKGSKWLAHSASAVLSVIRPHMFNS